MKATKLFNQRRLKTLHIYKIDSTECQSKILSLRKKKKQAEDAFDANNDSQRITELKEKVLSARKELLDYKSLTASIIINEFPQDAFRKLQAGEDVKIDKVFIDKYPLLFEKDVVQKEVKDGRTR